MTICPIKHIIISKGCHCIFLLSMIMMQKGEMSRYIIDFYENENGMAPAEDFIRGLDEKMQARIFRIIDILEKNGPEVRMPYSECLGDGIFEIRTKSGTDITRILYFFCMGKKIILTNGFVKKTQKTPKRQIALAKKYRADYERRFSI